MDECPGNSTECLLRAVLEGLKQNKAAIEEANADYNWDPATFAITLIIGVLAFIVACLTVFQGVLAAGPGRIKAGRSAIGPWSRYSKSRFSRSELGLRSTAKSPVLDRIWDVRFRLNFVDPIPRLPFQPFYHQYGSTWATLLHRVECNYAGLYTRTHNTDYLPADIPGVPALGRISLLVIMTALADDYCSVGVSPAKRYAEVECPHSALRMRDHSQLGTIAVFETWGTPNTLSGPRERRSYVFEDERSALRQIGEAWGLGFSGPLARSVREVNYPSISEMRIRTLESFIFDNHPNAHEGIFNLPLNLISFRVPVRPRLFAKKSVNLAKATMQLAQGSFWRASYLDTFISAWTGLLKNLWPNRDLVFPGRDDEYFDDLVRKAFVMVDFVEDNSDLHWTRAQGSVTKLKLQDERNQWSTRYSSCSIEVSATSSSFLSEFLEHVDNFCRTNEELPKDPLFLRGLSPKLAKGARAETQLMLQVLIKHIDFFLGRENRLDVHCALLALTRSIAICNTDREIPGTSPVTGLESPAQQGSHDSDYCINWPPARLGSSNGYKPMAKFDLPQGAYDEAYLFDVPEVYASLGAKVSQAPAPWNPDSLSAGPKPPLEYKPNDMNKIALLAETLRMRGLLVAAVLDLCADSTPLLADNFDDRLIAFI